MGKEYKDGQTGAFLVLAHNIIILLKWLIRYLWLWLHELKLCQKKIEFNETVIFWLTKCQLTK